MFAPFRTKYFPTKKFSDIPFLHIPEIKFGGEKQIILPMYGDNDKYVKAHASDDEDDLRCETLSEGALCKEGVWQVSLLSQVFATIIIIFIAIIKFNSEPIL